MIRNVPKYSILIIRLWAFAFSEGHLRGFFLFKHFQLAKLNDTAWVNQHRKDRQYGQNCKDSASSQAEFLCANLASVFIQKAQLLPHNSWARLSRIWWAAKRREIEHFHTKNYGDELFLRFVHSSWNLLIAIRTIWSSSKFVLGKESPTFDYALKLQPLNTIKDWPLI